METDYRIIILAVFLCLVFGDTKNYILNRLRGFENKAVRSVSAISLEFRRFIHGGNVNEVRFHIKKRTSEENEEAVRNTSGRQFDAPINQ